MDIETILLKRFEEHLNMMQEKIKHRDPLLAQGGFVYQYAYMEALADVAEQAGLERLAAKIDAALVSADFQRQQRGIRKCTCGNKYNAGRLFAGAEAA